MQLFHKAHLSKGLTSNKNAHNFWHHSWAKFLRLFYLTWSILFGVSALEPTFSKRLKFLKFFTIPSETSILRFLKPTLWTKWITPCESAWKTVPDNGVGNCVRFYCSHLSLLKDVKVVYLYWEEEQTIAWNVVTDCVHSKNLQEKKHIHCFYFITSNKSDTISLQTFSHHDTEWIESNEKQTALKIFILKELLLCYLLHEHRSYLYTPH